MLSFGVEEEYFLTDLHTRRMLAEPTAAVLAACRGAIGDGFNHEMFQGQIEAASPVFQTSDEAAAYLSTVRSNLAQALADARAAGADALGGLCRVVDGLLAQSRGDHLSVAAAD